jgi:hypothetical protein
MTQIKKNGVTMQEMCEHIVRADILQFKDGTIPKAEEIFNYSSSGELYMVFKWYEESCDKIGTPSIDTK